jgi:hypothetical protein
MGPAMASTPLLDDADYAAIEAAVVETARGRWFLAEFARRNRHADTQMLLEALARLENVVREERAALSPAAAEAKHPAPAVQPVPQDEADLHEEIASASAEPAAVVSPSAVSSSAADELAPFSATDNARAPAARVPAPPAWGESEILVPAPAAIAAPVSRGDPLAAIMALSYEEKIALFS